MQGQLPGVTHVPGYLVHRKDVNQYPFFFPKLHLLIRVTIHKVDDRSTTCRLSASMQSWMTLCCCNRFDHGHSLISTVLSLAPVDHQRMQKSTKTQVERMCYTVTLTLAECQAQLVLNNLSNVLILHLPMAVEIAMLTV